MSTFEERFWAKVDKTDGCWLWTGASSKGYGYIRSGKKNRIAPQVSWELAHGPIPTGMCVLHNCPDGDNPSCVNPSHLFLGTQGDNARDRNAKGRASSRVGVNNGRARLTERGVVVVREMAGQGMTHKAIGEYLGLHESTVRYAIVGKHWSHL